MSRVPTPASVTDRIHADHVALRDSMAALETALVPEEGADFDVWKLDVLQRLRKFQADLLQHFDLEEITNYGSDILGQAPQYAHRLDALEEEHLKIAADLDHVIAMTKRVQSMAAPILERLDKRLQAVLECLHRHEADERELLQDAYYQDMGIGD